MLLFHKSIHSTLTLTIVFNSRKNTLEIFVSQILRIVKYKSLLNWANNVKIIITIYNVKDVHIIVKSVIWIIIIKLSAQNVQLIISWHWIINIKGAISEIVKFAMSMIMNRCHYKKFYFNKIIKQNKLVVQIVMHLISWIYKLDNANWKR